MNFRPLVAFTALFLGSALGSAHGCGVSPSSSAPAQAGTGGGAASGPVTCAPTAPALLTSYTDLLSTLETGARVRVVLDYGKCKLSGSAGPAAKGAMNFDTYEWFAAGLIGNPKAFVATSTTQLINLSPNFVYDYVRVQVSEDNAVTIGVQYLDPTTFAVSVDETIECGISDATTARGATFYQVGS